MAFPREARGVVDDFSLYSVPHRKTNVGGFHASGVFSTGSFSVPVFFLSPRKGTDVRACFEGKVDCLYYFTIRLFLSVGNADIPSVLASIMTVQQDWRIPIEENKN